VAKKKNDEIMAHLHALKANVPTNSRRPTNSGGKETPAADIGIKPVVKPAKVKSVVTKSAKVKSVVKPAKVKSAKPIQAARTVVKPVAKPAVKPVAKPVVKPVAKPIDKAVRKPSVKPAVGAIIEAAVKPVVESAVRPHIEAASAPIPARLPLDLTEPDITVKNFGPGFMEIMIKNLDAMAHARDVLVGEMGKVNAIIINTFQRSMLVSFDIYKINANYIVEMLGAAVSPFVKPKNKAEK
jgi:hypothetical protein